MDVSEVVMLIGLCYDVLCMNKEAFMCPGGFVFMNFDREITFDVIT